MSTTNTRIVSLFILLMFCNCMTAQHRSEKDALETAQLFFGSKPSAVQALSIVPHANISRAIINKGLRKTRAKDDTASCYIINDRVNKRFVIVSADERMHEILGYSDNGIFDPDNASDGLLTLINGYDAEYKELLDGNIETMQPVRQAALPTIPPLITTTWGQTYPYNDQCPIDPTNNQNCKTGCLATATAQIMNYWKWPSVGHGEVNYKTKTLGIEQKMRFDSIPFDWNNMNNTYSGNYTNLQKEAVALMMHVCGNACLMDYNHDFSLAWEMDMAYALIHYFGYNPNLKYYDSQFFTSDDWEAIILDNLMKGMPIIYLGYDDNNLGHAFIIDGCNHEGYYHTNMGWEGTDDGFYLLNAINVPIKQYKFNLRHKMICYISKDTCESYEDGFVASTISLPQKITAGSKSSITIYDLIWKNAYYNTSNSTDYYPTAKYTGKLCFGLFDISHKLITNLFVKSLQLSSKEYYPKILLSFPIDVSLFTEGSQYYVAAYTTSDGGKTLSPIRTKDGATDYYLAQVHDSVVTFVPRGVPKQQLFGDADGDQMVNVTDIMIIIDYILGHNNSNFIFVNADVDENDVVDITDAMIVIDYILGKK